MIERIVNQVDGDNMISLTQYEYSPQELKGIISTFHLFVASRYHSLVASMSSCVPSIAIGWNHKYSGLFEEFGVEEYSFEINNEMDVVNVMKKYEKISSDEVRKEVLNNIKIKKDELAVSRCDINVLLGAIMHGE